MPNWYVRAGRVVAPVFLVSDYRNVGFAQTAVRQPYDVYEMNPLTHLDGGDIGAQYAVAGGTLSAQLTLGKAMEYAAINTPEFKASGNFASISGPAALFNLTYERSGSTLRAGYGKYRLGVHTNIAAFNLYDVALKAYQTAAPDYDSNLKLQRDDSSMWTFGYAYDDGPWLLQSEFAKSSARNILIPNQVAWYALGGYRVGKFTPYASFSKIQAMPRPFNRPDATRCGAVPGCAFGTVVIATVDSGLTVVREQSTIAVGTRYDFYRNLAFKAQIEHIRKPAMNQPNRGLFVNEYRDLSVSPRSTWLTQGHSVNLLTLALDFVF